MVFWPVRHEIESTVMLCRICNAELPAEAGFCPGCGAVNVQRLRTSGPAPKLDKETKALVHWLAQAHRQLTYPIDGAERIQIFRHGVLVARFQQSVSKALAKWKGDESSEQIHQTLS